MGLRWFCFIFILIQFINWCKRISFEHCGTDGAKWLGAIIGAISALVAWCSAFWFILFSQFI